MIQHTQILDKSIRWLQVPVDKIEAMNPWWLSTRDKASKDETFRSYIEGHEMKVPADMGWARSVVIVALEFTTRLLPFWHEGKRKTIIQAPSYYQNSVTRAMIRDYLVSTLDSGLGKARVEDCYSLPVKLLTASSGLGKYGRNNIVYVEGMGTAHALLVFWTDAPVAATRIVADAPLFKSPYPGPATLARCETCAICIKTCPTCAIPKDFGLINADVCLPLWNETEHDFPPSIPKTAHNALMGCVICQKNCPENQNFYEPSRTLPELSAESTAHFLTGNWDPELKRIMTDIMSTDDEETLKAHYPIFQRNLKVFVAAGKEA